MLTIDAANCAFNHCNNMRVVLVQELYAFVSQSLGLSVIMCFTITVNGHLSKNGHFCKMDT